MLFILAHRHGGQTLCSARNKEGRSVGAGSTKVLIIEDERDVRLYLANLLRTNGYDALTAANIAEGMNLACSARPALVVLDAMLPGDEAQRLYAQFRCQADLCSIPVVLLASITRRALGGSRFYGGGASPGRLSPPDAILTKPPEAEDFLEVVRRLTAVYEQAGKEGAL